MTDKENTQSGPLTKIHKSSNPRWEDEYYVKAYELARDGLTNQEIASALGVALNTFKVWLSKSTLLQRFIDRGRSYLEEIKSDRFSDYVFNKLPDHLQETWRKIEISRHDPSFGDNPLYEVSRMNKADKQQLFLYAYTSSLFSISEAARKTGITRKAAHDWMKDPEFSALMREIDECKKDFCESAFLHAVGRGDTPCIIHAAKTLLKDRGYNERIDVHHTGNVDINVVFDLDALDLPVDVLCQVMEAYDRKQLGITSKDESIPQIS